MERDNLNRREFHTLAAAAVGGAIAGSIAGCSKKSGKSGVVDKKSTDEKGDGKVAELHLCKGLNTCKGKGKGGKNDCKGMGSCATYKAHTCAGENDCKGQGGCQGKVGTNECKKKGSCNVPLTDDAWKEAKAAFDKKHGLGKSAAKKTTKT
jgi:hypothetical protein